MPDKTGTASAAAVKRSRWIIIGLFALFFAPILFAYLLNVLRPDWQPFGSVNRGSLFNPAIKIDLVKASNSDATPQVSGSEPMRPPWRLAYLGPAPCDEPCLLIQGELRRVIPALGRRADRVEAIWIVPVPQQTPDIQSGVQSNTLAMYAVRSGLEQIQAVARLPLILLIDPRGFAILHYSIDAKATAIIKDLERLLRISKID